MLPVPLLFQAMKFTIATWCRQCSLHRVLPAMIGANLSVRGRESTKGERPFPPFSLPVSGSLPYRKMTFSIVKRCFMK